MRVLAVDPGPHTGMAEWGDDGTYNAWELAAEEVGVHVHARCVPVPMLPRKRVDVIVIESFHISGQTHKKSQHGLVSIELIGVCRYLAIAYGVRFATQTPSEAKTFSTDAKLRAAGWWTKGSDHARDASRHLLLFLAKEHLIDLGKLIQ